MSKVTKGIYARLAGQSAVTNLVGTRIYPGIAPPNAAFPYLVYGKAGSVGIHAMKNDPNLLQYQIQVSACSTSYSQAKAVALQVRTALQDYSGTTGSITFKRIFFDNEGDLPSIDAKTKGIRYQVIQNFTMWHD